MALATLVNTIGHGMFMVAAVLYFTRIQGFSATQIGVGLTISGLFGMAAGVPIGHLSDRYGARELLIGLLIATGFAASLIPFADTWWVFVVMASVMTTFDRGSAAVRSALIATSVRGPQRLRMRAYLRAINNVGVSVGAALGAVALFADTRLAYTIVLVGNGVSCFVAAWVLRRYPHVPPVAKEAGAPISQVFRDKPYLLVTIIMSAMGVQFAILDVGIPLWIDNYTSAPNWIVAALFILNTGVVVLGQVGVGRRVESIRVAARAMSVAGVVFCAACVVFSLSEGRGAGTAIAILFAAGLLHVTGELLQTSAQFCLGQDLAPDHAQGQYQGMATTGFSLSTMLGPAVITLLPIALGQVGWWILGGVFVALAVAILPAVRWAERTRPQYGAARPDSGAPGTGTPSGPAGTTP